uniref:Uncharacterized protein n=1 Tax=Solanum lycopersicum TaxID=4081 RepID=K4BJ70_SOLLC
MAEELDQKQTIASLRHEIDYLLMKIHMSEATHKYAFEARKLKIWFLKQKFEEVDNTVKFYRGEIETLERENEDLKLKLNRMDIELLKKKNELVKIQIKELEAKVAELENKRKIQDNEISQSLTDENKYLFLALFVGNINGSLDDDISWKHSIAAMDRCSGAPFIIVAMISKWGSRTNLLKKVNMLETTHKVRSEEH